MDGKRITSLILLFIFAITMVSSVSFAADDRSYSIPWANIDLYVQENGNLHVKETLHYSFSGTYRGVYRDIPLKSGERIENLNVSTKDVYSDFTISKSGDNERVTVYLYSDAQKTLPITDRDVEVIYEYDFINVIKIYNDVAELQYKLWGEGWEVDVGQVTGNIHVKSSKGVKDWLNPPYYVLSSIWDNNVFTVDTTSISAGNWFEVRMAIPKDQFTNPIYARQVNASGLQEMEKIQQDYQNELNFKTTLYSILAILMVLSVFVPIIIYLKFGREPKIDYKAEYERDLPTKDPPAVVNAISGKGFSKGVGDPNMDGFRATIMDLINRKYLTLGNVPDNVDENHKKNKDKPSVFLKINDTKDFSALKYYEQDVISFLRKFEWDGVVYLDQLKQDLKDQTNAKSFKESYDLWKDDLKNEFLSNEKLKQLFIKSGDTYLKIFGGLGIVLAIIVFFFTIFDPLPASSYALLGSIVLGLVSIISLILPQKIAGRWTVEGEEFDAKWQNFRKYIQDFSLIKEYPPESIIVWNKYLVYATALGVADKVRKSMEMSLPSDELARSDLYLFHYYGGYVILSSSLDSGMATATGGNGAGGVGGVGGGSGGGGGGAF